MRKRPSRPARFAAVDNQAIDSLPSILAVGLLTRLIRAQDGDDVTVESLAREYDEGESALSKAMRALVHDAHVVKFKVQRAATETFTDADGITTVKRGGSWYTTFSVDSIPFTRDDVAVMMQDIVAGGNVKAMRVEPTHLDPREELEPEQARPTPQNAGVGPTRENTDSGPASEDRDPRGDWPRPTPQEPGAGRPTPGQGGAHTETGFKDEGKTAHPARSAMDAGGHTSGSSDSGGRSGCAASGKKKSTVKLSMDELRAVHQVMAFYPPTLNPPRAPELMQAIVDALATGMADCRTVEQIGERIRSRWIDHGYAQQAADGKIRSAVGVAVGLVRAYKRGDKYACADPRCEDGANIDTGEICRACQVRIADRRADRQRDAQQDDRLPPGPGAVADVPESATGEAPAGASEAKYPAARETAPVPYQFQPMGDYSAGAAAARSLMRGSKSEAYRRANRLPRGTA